MSGREPTRALKRTKADQVRGSMPTSIARRAIRITPPTGIDAQVSQFVENYSLRNGPALRQSYWSRLLAYGGDSNSTGLPHSVTRNAGLMAADSDRALIIPAELDASFAHDGMRPQRTSERSRRGSLGCWRMIGTDWVGATL